MDLKELKKSATAKLRFEVIDRKLLRAPNDLHRTLLNENLFDYAKSMISLARREKVQFNAEFEKDSGSDESINYFNSYIESLRIAAKTLRTLGSLNPESLKLHGQTFRAAYRIEALGSKLADKAKEEHDVRTGNGNNHRSDG